MSLPTSRQQRRPWNRHGVWLFGLVALCVALLAGCETNAVVRVNVKPDGSGTIVVDVTLDKEASAKVGDLSKVVQFGDLTKAGWTVKGPGKPADVLAPAPGTAEFRSDQTPHSPNVAVAVRISKPFANVAQANAILASISGPDGPLRGVKLTRSSSFTSTKFSMVGTVDLSGGLDVFGDSALTKTLGASMAETATQFNGGKPLAGQLEVSLSVPSENGLSWSGENGGGKVTPKRVVASTPLGGKPDRIDVHASQTHWTAILLALAACCIILAALALQVVPMVTGKRPVPRDGRRQRHSAHDSWEYVEQRGGLPTVPPKLAKGGKRRGRHSRPRGEPPRWKVDEIEIDPIEAVRPRPDDAGPDDGGTDRPS